MIESRRLKLPSLVLGHPSLLVLGHSKSWDTGRVNQVLASFSGSLKEPLNAWVLPPTGGDTSDS